MSWELNAFFAQMSFPTPLYDLSVSLYLTACVSAFYFTWACSNEYLHFGVQAPMHLHAYAASAFVRYVSSDLSSTLTQQVSVLFCII